MIVPHDSPREMLLKKAKMKAKKKPRRRSDSSGGYTLSDIIQSPPAAGKLTHTEDILFWHMLFIKDQQDILHFTLCFQKVVVIISLMHFSFLSVVSASLVKSGKANSTESLQELLTSDSEGSYMGVGSPRDMQSPVFHDRAEVNIWQNRSYPLAIV